jgi:hypothetical protein
MGKSTKWSTPKTKHKVGYSRGKTYEGRGAPKGEANPAWIDGRTEFFKTAKKEVLKRSKCSCEKCARKEEEGGGRFELAHIKSLEELAGDYSKYHSAKNIRYYCNSCHKLFDYQKGERRPAWSKGKPTLLSRIVSIVPDGEEEVYDIEMNTIGHNFIANGIVSHNSHSVSYSMLSFQCAWLCNYYPSEWAASFLDKEPEQKKEKAINIVKSHGFNIQHLDVNKSGKVWEISEDGRTLIQPLTSIKGLGEAAIDQILDNRPFKTVEHFLYSEEIVYSKLNKKCRDALVKSGAMNCLIDDRFEHQQHFWACVADKPKTIEKFHETIELTKCDVDFTEEEKIQHLVSLTGVFPMSLVMTPELEQRLEEECVPPLSEYDLSLGVAWFIPREVIPKKTKNGKDYYIVEAIDSTNTTTKIKCWGVNRERDIIHVNRPYMAQLKYSEDWGFSCHSVRHNFVLLA